MAELKNNDTDMERWVSEKTPAAREEEVLMNTQLLNLLVGGLASDPLKVLRGPL